MSSMVPTKEKQEVLDNRKEHKLKIQQRVEELEALIKELDLNDEDEKEEITNAN